MIRFACFSVFNRSREKMYLANCFLLIVPILVWNLIFINKLPDSYAREFFWNNIPAVFGTTENVTRLLVFTLPLLMKFSLTTRQQKVGFGIYLVGIFLYFLSWTLQIYLPHSRWASSAWGYIAPAYTTIIFFVGIGLIGHTTYVKTPYATTGYLLIAVIFVASHTIHCFLVFQRL